jgi:DNA repair protein RadC
MKLLEISKNDRPREKLASKGPAALSDIELIQVIVGSGVQGSGVIAISKQIKRLLDLYGYELSLEQLQSIKGVNSATATKLVALFELASRKFHNDVILDSATAAVALVPELRDLKQEHLVVLSLDGANRLIAKRTVSIGTLTNSLVHPREVFAEPITDRAAGIIIIHNHPSGNLQASGSDIEITTRLIEAGTIVGITLIDHIIITRTAHISLLKEEND